MLEAAGAPVGIVTAVRGCRRFRNAACLGRVAHSGAEPRAYRADPVAAAVDLVHRLEAKARSLEAAGQDVTFTVGEFYTDPATHGPSQVAGRVTFVLDFRSTDDAVVQDLQREAESSACRLELERRVRFELGPVGLSLPAEMDRTLISRLSTQARDFDIPAMRMASGGGHDATVYALAGIPSAMLFVRNRHGSHNPREDMAMADLSIAAQIVCHALA